MDRTNPDPHDARTARPTEAPNDALNAPNDLNEELRDALRALPSVDALLRSDKLRGVPPAVATREARCFLHRIREELRAGRIGARAVSELFGGDGAERRLLELCRAAQTRHHRRVVNATGIVLHTGIGRAPLAEAARDALQAAAGYAIVEVDPDSGERNQRETAVARLLCDLTGAEGALVVNNNAAMVNLTLCSLARGTEVVVSRGELVEIGGGFRMPDVMAQAGCRLVEVGSTNRTHLRDYRQAIGADTGMLMKVHPSNFLVLGFHKMPGLAEIAELGRSHGIMVFEDLGSGLLCEEPVPGLENEPRVRASLAAGAPLVSFSGDKLLGGPQCGILVGEAAAVARVRAHPLYRAFRCDKLTLAALEATLLIYRSGRAAKEIPTLAAIAHPAPDLRVRAQRLAAALGGLGAEVVESESFVGSGANPARPLPSFAVALPGGAAALAALRKDGDVPVIGRIERDRVLLDLRTLLFEDPEEVAELVRNHLAGSPLS